MSLKCKFIFYRITFAMLFAFALFWTFISVMGRPDTQEEVSLGKAQDLFILAPLWASVAFFGFGYSLRDRPRGQAIAFGVSIATWLALALMFTMISHFIR